MFFNKAYNKANFGIDFSSISKYLIYSFLEFKQRQYIFVWISLVIKKPQLDIVSWRPHHSWGRNEKLCFLHTLGHWKMHFPKPGKYSIIDKSTTFSTSCHPYLKSKTFTSFLDEFQQWQFWRVGLFFSRKTGIPVKTGKITGLSPSLDIWVIPSTPLFMYSFL